jgi:hypothetical protein
MNNIIYSPEICAWCSGRGSILFLKCNVCHGQGSVLVAQPAIKCGYCHGSGRSFLMRCSACKGTGWAHYHPWFQFFWYNPLSNPLSTFFNSSWDSLFGLCWHPHINSLFYVNFFHWYRIFGDVPAVVAKGISRSPQERIEMRLLSISTKRSMMRSNIVG